MRRAETSVDAATETVMDLLRLAFMHTFAQMSSSVDVALL